MNLQRREEIRELIAEITRYEELGATLDLESKARDAITELLAHIDTLEQTAAERVIADGSRGPTPGYTGEGSAWVPPVEAPAVVVPEPTSDEWRAIAENARSSDMVDFLAGAAAYSLWLRRRARTIPANRALGDGMVAVDQEEWEAVQAFAVAWFAGRPDGEVHDASSAWFARRQALRANQGGAT